MLTMMMSIAHRIWRGERGRLRPARLVARRDCRRADAYAQVSQFFSTTIGRIVLFLFTWSLVHHMLGGMRHLVWDTGRALDKTSIEVLAWLTIIGSITLTVLIWYVGLTR